MSLPIAKSRLDGDAAAYIARSGAQDRAAINAFVRGVKALGLWETMVCWPLRSSQNAGVGDTVYSLGGLGTFNGTRVNGPAWTTDGLTFDATNKSVQLQDDSSLYSAASGFVVFKTSANNFNQSLIEFQDGINPSSYFCLFRYSGQSAFGEAGIKLTTTRAGAVSGNANASRVVDLSTFQSGAFTKDDSTDNVFRNGTIETGGARAGLSALNASGSRNTRILFGNTQGMSGAFGLLSSAYLTNSQINSLHQTYKQTLGTGLGLP